MKCQNCGDNEANFRYTEIINGVKKEIALCDECRKKMGLQGLDFNMPINFSSFFGDFLNDYDSLDAFPILTKQNPLKCTKCGMTYEQFIKDGKFGCSDCYSVFESKIDPLLKRIHGSNKYLGRKGKKPIIELPKQEEKPEEIKKDDGKTEKENKIADMKKELKKLIKEEKYEEAAVLRDKIKEVEREN